MSKSLTTLAPVGTNVIKLFCTIYAAIYAFTPILDQVVTESVIT